MTPMTTVTRDMVERGHKGLSEARQLYVAKAEVREILEAALAPLPDGYPPLPCDVHLPPSTFIKKGCPMSVAIDGIMRREGKPDGLARFADGQQAPAQVEVKPLEWSYDSAPFYAIAILPNGERVPVDSLREKSRVETAFNAARATDAKPLVNIGTIGHVDHGKTSLTAAIVTAMSAQPNVNAKPATDAKPVADAGWVMVPREPDDGMIEAGEEEIACRKQSGCRVYASDIYEAMIAAAPTGGKADD